MHSGEAAFSWTLAEDMDIIGPMALRVHIEARGADDVYLFAGALESDLRRFVFHFMGSRFSMPPHYRYFDESACRKRSGTVMLDFESARSGTGILRLLQLRWTSQRTRYSETFTRQSNSFLRKDSV